jgi:predicted esterase
MCGEKKSTLSPRLFSYSDGKKSGKQVRPFCASAGTAAKLQSSEGEKMPRICFIVFCLLLLYTNIAYVQDKIAKTAGGQIVILRKDGTWNLQYDSELRDNKAITEDGQLVLLARNGKWFSTNVNVNSPTRRQESSRDDEKKYSSATGTFAFPYSSSTVSGTGRVHVPPIVKDGPAQPRPLMLLLDPDGNAVSIVARWQHAADRLGWIVASSSEIMNGTSDDQDIQHLSALLDAITAKWSVDAHAIILGGFSGGACSAYFHALVHPDLFRGAIVECGHMGAFRNLHHQISPGSIFFLATRTQDFNSPATHTLAKALEQNGETVKLIELPGGHEPLRGSDADGALEWIDSMIK